MIMCVGGEQDAFCNANQSTQTSLDCLIFHSPEADLLSQQTFALFPDNDTKRARHIHILLIIH